MLRWPHLHIHLNSSFISTLLEWFHSLRYTFFRIPDMFLVFPTPGFCNEILVSLSQLLRLLSMEYTVNDISDLILSSEQKVHDPVIFTFFIPQNLTPIEWWWKSVPTKCAVYKTPWTMAAVMTECLYDCTLLSKSMETNFQGTSTWAGNHRFSSELKAL